MNNSINSINKQKAALLRVLTNLSKAVLSIKCTFRFLSPKDSAVGYTFQKTNAGKSPVAEIYINREHEMFDKLPENLKNVAVFGVAVHEMLHQKFTNFIEFEKTLKRTPYEKLNILKTIFNVFEDSRIEYFANQVFGGKALSSLKYCINFTWEQSPEINKTAHPFYQIMNALIQYGDTGKIKGSFSDDDTRDTFLYCCELFDKAIVSVKCTDCLKYSVECTDFLYNKYLEKLLQALRNNIIGGGSGTDAKEQPKGSKTANAKQQNRKTTKQQQNKPNEANEEQNAADGNSQNTNNTNSSSTDTDTSNDNSDEEGKEVTYDDFVFDEEDVQSFAEELEGKMDAALNAIEQETKISEGDVYTFRLDDAECKVCEYRIIPCDEGVFRSYQEYAEHYNITSYSDELAKDMEVLLKTRPTGWERNKSGKLNIKRWMDPNFNSPYIFDKKLQNDSSVAVSILIDESASMHSKDRIDHVRQMAVVLAEAFLKLGIKFNILGHTGGEQYDNANTIREYSDFDSDVFEQVIGICARSYNYDGASIKVAADKLAKREERNKLMFVLTDGASHNVANTELAIRDANKIGTVLGVALACGSDRQVIEKMYGQNFVMVEKMDDLLDTIVDKLKEVSSLWS